MLSALVGTLALSRSTFVRCSENKKVETLAQAHKRFFDAIPGTPHTILSDNKVVEIAFMRLREG
jgi:transposase